MAGVDEAAVIGGLGGGAVGGSSGLGEIANLFGNAGSIIGNVAGIGGALFGTGSKSKTSATTSEVGTITEQTKIDQEGVDKIVRDILSSANGGIGDIFSAENVAGIFDSSVAAQASGNLVANLAGEIAKLTAKKEVKKDTTTTQKSKTKSKSKGLFG